MTEGSDDLDVSEEDARAVVEAIEQSSMVGLALLPGDHPSDQCDVGVASTEEVLRALGYDPTSDSVRRDRI